MFTLERNFGYEIQEYITLKREFKKRKEKLLNGEISMEEFNTNQDPNDDRDPKTIELCKK